MRLTRRAFLAGSAAARSARRPGCAQQRRLFDSHCHIIDHRFPIVANQGYTPPNFPLEDYLAQGEAARRGGRRRRVRLVPGQRPDLSDGHPAEARPRLGRRDADPERLSRCRDRAGSASSACVRCASTCSAAASTASMTSWRWPPACHAVAGWHSEMYADAAALRRMSTGCRSCRSSAIDHLGMTEAGMPVLLDLVAAGCKVKATGFGRVKLDVPKTLEAIAKKNPERAGVRHRHPVDARAAAVRGRPTSI